MPGKLRDGSRIPILLSLLFGGLTISILPCNAQHSVDGYFTTPNEWDTSRSTVTTQAYSSNFDGSGGSTLYAEHVYPVAPPGPTSYDMLYFMDDYTGSAPGATAANTQSYVFFQESALYCQGDYLVTFGPNGFAEYTQNYYDTIDLNPDGSFYLGADSGWGPLDGRDLSEGNLLGAEGFGASPTDPNNHLMAEFGMAIYEKYGGYYWQGILSPTPPTFFSFSSVTSGSDPVSAAGYITLNSDGTTSIDLTDPANTSLSVIGSNGGLDILPPTVSSQIVGAPESGPTGFLMGALSVAGVLFFRHKRRFSRLSEVSNA